MKKSKISQALKITVIYALIGGGWILFSDRIVERLFSDPAQLSVAQTYKGWFYVAATGWLLFILVKNSQSSKQTAEHTEKQYRMLVEQLPAVVFMDKFNESQTTQYISPRIKDLLGYTAEEWEAAGNIWKDSLHPEDKERVLAEDVRTNQTGESFNIEYRLRHRDGHYVWIQENASVIRDEDGASFFWQGILSDVTAQKATAEATQKHLKELIILHAVAQAESTADSTDELIQRVTNVIGNTLYPDNCGVLLLNKTGDELIPHFSYRGVGKEQRANIPLTIGIVGKVAATGRSIRLGDVSREPAYREATSGIKSEICVPIIDELKTIGVINVESREQNAFTRNDERLLNTIAGGMVNYIKKINLFQEESRRSKIIEALANIANEIAKTQEVIPALDKIAHFSLALLNAGTLAIYLLQEDNQTIKIVSAQGNYQKEFLSHTIRIGEGVTGSVIASGIPEIVADVTNDPRSITVLGTPEEEVGHDTLMSAPLILHGISIGAINAWRKKLSGVFDKSELNFLVNIAHQTSITIESARLFQEVRRRAQESAAIAEVGRDISATLNLDIVLERIATYAKDLLEADTSAVYLAESDSPFLRAIAAVGIDSNEIEADPVQRGEGILGNIALRKSGEIVNNTAGDARAITVKGTEVDLYENLMGVPFFSKDQMTGLLAVWKLGKGNEFQRTDLEFLNGLAQQAAVAIENARLFELEQKRRQESETIRQAAAALTDLLDLPSLHNAILDWLHKIAPYDSASILEIEEDYIRITAARGLPTPEKALEQIFPADNILCTLMKETGEPLIIADCEKDPRFEKWGGINYARGWMGAPLISRGQVIGYITLDSHTPNAYTQNEAAAVQTFAHQAATSLENTRLFTETRQRLSELEIISRVSFSLRAAHDTKEMFPILLGEIKSSMDTDSVAIWLYDPEKNELQPMAASGQFADLPESTFKPDEGTIGKVYSSGIAHISDQFFDDPAVAPNIRLSSPDERLSSPVFIEREKGRGGKSTYIYGHITMIPKESRFFGKNWGGIIVPIRTASETIGALAVALRAARKIETHHIRLVTTLAEIAGNAIYRSNLYERSEKQITQLTTLRELDTAIVSSFDLKTTLNIVVESMLAKMNVDAAAVLVFNPDSQMLEYSAAAGFNNREPLRAPVGIGDELTSRILLSRQAQYISDIATEHSLRLKVVRVNEKFTSYYAVPLFSKGATRGIIEVYFRSPFSPTAEWADFMNALAGQAIIAIDNTQLFENLQRSNQELSLAYDTTLEGWGKALELRDKETEGHTRRVTDLTLELARQMNIPASELLNIRRGALLHDIGKMGVPDNILRKAGTLTKEEKIEMRKHPQYAHDLLYPINYLRPAIDIAYYHHEWWDGNGYPRGLKGAAIPLAARIFAVIDVWDALLSDRPYRLAWTEKKTLKYIKDLSGKQFDPRVVEAFCRMIENKRPL